MVIRKSIASVLLALTAGQTLAQETPGLFDAAAAASVSILAEPDAGSASIGEIPSGTKGIEVVSLSQDGQWGEVNSGERSGWVALSQLMARGGASWASLEGSMTCLGTEPFWSATLIPGSREMQLAGLDARDARLTITQTAIAVGVQAPPLGIEFTAPGLPGFAVITPGICSDGMSELAYGLTATFFVGAPDGPMRGLSGCCSIAPD
jgi:uncharacterized membrane protein